VTLVFGVLLALLAVFAVVLPILRPPAGAPKPSILFDEPEDDPLEHRKALALAALKEIEFDRETGKLSDADYQAMLERYTREAVEALRAADVPAAQAAEAGAPHAVVVAAGSGGNGHAAEPAGAAPSAGGPTSAGAMASPEDAVERLIAEARQAGKGQKFCINCGAVLEGSGRFCVECGARV